MSSQILIQRCKGTTFFWNEQIFDQKSVFLQKTIARSTGDCRGADWVISA